MSRPAAAQVERAPHETVLTTILRYRNFILLSLDVIVIAGAFLGSYYVRFYLQFMVIQQEVIPVPDIQPYLGAATLLTALWLALTWHGGGYERGLGGTVPLENAHHLLVAGSYAITGLMVTSFMIRGLLLSRQVYVMTFLFSSAGMLAARLLLRALDDLLKRRGFANQLAIIVGTDEQAQDFARLLQQAGNALVVGHVTWSRDALAHGLRPIGSIEQLEQLHSQYRFNNLVFSFSENGGASERVKERMFEILNFCEVHRISLYVINNSFDVAISPREVGSIRGIPLIQLQDASLHPGYALVKRLIDITASLLVLIVGAPLWLTIATLIKLDSKGPVLFSQMRAGLHGKPFRIYKFRSMANDAESRLNDLIDIDLLAEPVFKIKSDPRVTRLGKLLRRTGLDEIPQFINVLKGEMSIVGPRPEEINMVARYSPWQKRRLKAKPGITGYQQINNRGEASLSKRVRYDLVYLKQQGLVLDAYIMAKTLAVMVKGSGVTH
jgi:exopolysaccharide biosynthesis polyprenyl glycosylphosphotransferase